MVRFVLRHGPFCPKTWSVLSGPFCQWSVLSEYQENHLCTTVLYPIGDASWLNLFIPLSNVHPGIFSGNTVYCFSPMNWSIWFLKVFNVGAVTTISGKAFHDEITLEEKKKFFPISFLHDFFVQFECMIPGFIRVREMSGKFKIFQSQGIVREFHNLSGKIEFLLNCRGNVREF